MGSGLLEEPIEARTAEEYKVFFSTKDGHWIPYVYSMQS